MAHLTVITQEATLFDEALGVPFVGFATYGEMAMQMGQTSGYHNMTTVVFLLPK